jgi:hypothetical protein
MRSKHEIENEFEWWVTCIPDKIYRLEELLPIHLYTKLDYSINSLGVIGEYICGAIQSIESLTQNDELWDCLASYIGTTYRRNVPTAEWRIELDDEKSIYLGVPALRTKANTNFYPKYEITAMLDRKRPDFLQAITKRHTELQTSQ